MQKVWLVVGPLLAAGCTPGASPLDLHASDGTVARVSAPPDAAYAPGRVIVGFDGGALPLVLQRGIDRLDLVRGLRNDNAGLYAFDPATDALEMVRRLSATGRYAYVEPDWRRSASVNDTHRHLQWHFDHIEVDAAWAHSTGEGIVVAVIDTGVLDGILDGITELVAGYDFVRNDDDPEDVNGHGTHVAGTVNQVTDNATGTAGVAYDAAIMPVKVLDYRGQGWTSDVIDGIDFATENGANVINLSLGGGGFSITESESIINAYETGVFIAAASGNESSTVVSYPARYPESVAVGATNASDGVTWYSNEGPNLDLVAPGGDLYRDDNGDGYGDGVLQETFDPYWEFWFWHGTSMASPHVAGAAALLMSVGATNAEAEQFLKDTALDLGSAGFDESYGYGLIQLDAAFDAAMPFLESPDDDGDGFRVISGDCDDSDPNAHPDAEEICDDGIDQDCDGEDRDCRDCEITEIRARYDADLDELMVTAMTFGGASSVELWTDGEYADDMPPRGLLWGTRVSTPEQVHWIEVVADCGGSAMVVVPCKGDECVSGDTDGDGYHQINDCDETSAEVNPGATEICYDGVDQDCDGSDVCLVEGRPEIQGGEAHTCQLDDMGLVLCWGNEDDGRIDAPDGAYSQIDAGRAHNCAVADDQTAHCWGSNDVGQATAPDGEFTRIDCGQDHTCALGVDGVVQCWGSDEHGQASPPDGAFVGLTSGMDHSCALTAEGDITCWGSDAEGQVSAPDGTWIKVVAGDAHTCALDDTGSVTCWGSDAHGQSTPIDGVYIDIGAGAEHTCGIDLEAQLACWGNDTDGQASPPSGSYARVSSGGQHGCAIDADGTVTCWGRDDYGQASPP